MNSIRKFHSLNFANQYYTIIRNLFVKNNPITLYVPLRPITLRFPDDNDERAFCIFHNKLKIGTLRLSLCLAIILNIIYQLNLDIYIMSDVLHQVHAIRNVITIVLLLTLVFSLPFLPFESYFLKNMQIIVSVVSFLASFGIICMIYYGKGIGSALYVGGIITVVLWIYTIAGLRFKYSFSVCFLLLIGCELVTFLINPIDIKYLIDPDEKYIAIGNHFFLITVFILSAIAGYNTERYSRIAFYNDNTIDKRLNNTFPESIVPYIKKPNGEALTIETSNNVAVLFADIVNFTQYAFNKEPKDVVDFLTKIFDSFDDVIDGKKGKVEKIKTIGDAYMISSGLLNPCDDYVEQIADTALEMLEKIPQLRNLLNVSDLNIRIGIHVGRVIGGVTGQKRSIYDLWGETVNTASRMESYGKPGFIQLLIETKVLLDEKYTFEDGVKGKIKGLEGIRQTYYLTGKRETII